MTAAALALPLIAAGLIARAVGRGGLYVGCQLAVVALAAGSLLLTRLGSYSLPLACALSLALGAALAACRPGHDADRDEPAAVEASPGQRLAAGALIAALVALIGAFPSYSLLAGRDMGNYLLQAVWIADSGGLAMDMPWLADGAVPEPLLRRSHEPDRGARSDLIDRSGFMAVKQAPGGQGVGIPQWVHLYSALGAGGFAAFGLEGLVRVNALLALLALWSLWRLGLRLLGPRGALLTVACFGLCPALIIWARDTVSEPLTLALGLLGLELAMRAHDEGSPSVAALAGLVWGLAITARVDAVLWCLAVGAALLAALAGGRPRLGAALLLGYLIGFALAAVDVVLHCRLYLANHIGFEQRWPLMLVGAIGGAIAGLAACRWLPAGAARWLIAGAARLGAWGFAGWVAWALGVRAWVWEDSFQARAAVELSWYVTPLGLPLAAWGAITLARCEQARLRWLPLILTGCAVTAIYTIDPRIYDDHPWASRRWLPLTIPLVALLALRGATALLRDRPRRGLIAGAALAFSLGWALVFSWPFLFTALGAERRAPLLALRAETLTALPAGQRFLREQGASQPFAVTPNPALGPTLTFFCRRPTAILTARGMLAIRARPSDRRQGAGLERYGVFDGYLLVGFTSFHAPYGELRQRRLLPGLAFEGRVGRWPRLVYRERTVASEGLLRATTAALRLELDGADPAFSTRVGRVEGRSLVSSGAGGALLGGPYVNLRRGRYRLTVTARLLRAESERDELAALRIWPPTRRRNPARVELRQRGRELTLRGHQGEPQTLEVGQPFEMTMAWKSKGQGTFEVQLEVRAGVVLAIDRLRLEELEE